MPCFLFNVKAFFEIKMYKKAGNFCSFYTKKVGTQEAYAFLLPTFFMTGSYNGGSIPSPR